jgi:tetratricopeptide (TPR) repeat protein
VAENLAAVRENLPNSVAGLVVDAESGGVLPAWDRLRGPYLQGIQAFRDDRLEDSLEALLTARAIAPNDRDVLSFLERVGEDAARDFVAAGGLNRREPLLGCLAAQFPDSAILQMAWGLSLIQVTAKTHDAEPARRGIARLREAVRLAPDDPYVLDVVGQACLSMEAWPAALPLLERLSSLQPDNAAVLCNLARAQIGMRQYEQARQTLDGALRVSPAFSAAKDLQEQLALYDVGQGRESAGEKP